MALRLLLHAFGDTVASDCRVVAGKTSALGMGRASWGSVHRKLFARWIGIFTGQRHFLGILDGFLVSDSHWFAANQKMGRPIMASRTLSMRNEERWLHEIVLRLWLKGKSANEITREIRRQRDTDPELLKKVISRYPIPSPQILKSVRESEVKSNFGLRLMQAISPFLFGTRREARLG